MGKEWNAERAEGSGCDAFIYDLEQVRLRRHRALPPPPAGRLFGWADMGVRKKSCVARDARPNRMMAREHKPPYGRETFMDWLEQFLNNEMAGGAVEHREDRSTVVCPLYERGQTQCAANSSVLDLGVPAASRV